MKAPEPNPVLPEHRALFLASLHKWQAVLGLDDWRVNLSRKSAGKGMMARVKCHHQARLADFYLGPDFGSTPVTPESIDGTALHEMLHVLTYELYDQNTIGLEGVPLDSAEHRVIHVLESLLKGR